MREEKLRDAWTATAWSWVCSQNTSSHEYQNHIHSWKDYVRQIRFEILTTFFPAVNNSLRSDVCVSLSCVQVFARVATFFPTETNMPIFTCFLSTPGPHSRCLLLFLAPSPATFSLPLDHVFFQNVFIVYLFAFIPSLTTIPPGGFACFLCKWG